MKMLSLAIEEAPIAQVHAKRLKLWLIQKKFTFDFGINNLFLSSSYLSTPCPTDTHTSLTKYLIFWNSGGHPCMQWIRKTTSS